MFIVTTGRQTGVMINCSTEAFQSAGFDGGIDPHCLQSADKY